MKESFIHLNLSNKPRVVSLKPPFMAHLKWLLSANKDYSAIINKVRYQETVKATGIGIGIRSKTNPILSVSLLETRIYIHDHMFYA
jgi:hypothetical protein